MGDVVLELKGIVKSFPGVLALDGIDFELKSGEVHAICGENGAGKSTLMKVVCGVHKPDKGIICLLYTSRGGAGPFRVQRAFPGYALWCGVRRRSGVYTGADL